MKNKIMMNKIDYILITIIVIGIVLSVYNYHNCFTILNYDKYPSKITNPSGLAEVSWNYCVENVNMSQQYGYVIGLLYIIISNQGLFLLPVALLIGHLIYRNYKTKD